MTPSPWASIGDPAALVGPALELHHAAQLVASAGQTFVEPRPDDSHRAMTWDRRRRAFVGAPFAGAYPFRVALRPEDLSLLLLDRTEHPLATLPLAGRTPDEACDWLGIGMATYLGGAPPVLVRPEYDLPDHEVRDGGRFTGGYDEGRRALADLYGAADALIRECVGGRNDASAVRCWPHHFDLASLVTVEADEHGTAKKTIGIGFAPGGDDVHGSWYLYVAPWPPPAESSLPPLTPPASWHGDGWVGAVLTGQAVAAMAPADREPALHAFFHEAVGAAYAALGR